MTAHAHSGLDRAQLGLADPAEQPGKVRFGCVRLRCSTAVEWCGARSKRSTMIGQACYGCELGKSHEQYAGEPTPLRIRSKREAAIRDVDATRHAKVRERARQKAKRPKPKGSRWSRAELKAEPGDAFGQWTVVEEGARKRYAGGNVKRMVKVKCSCGMLAVRTLNAVVRGRSTQCKSCAVRQAQQARRVDRQPSPKPCADCGGERQKWSRYCGECRDARTRAAERERSRKRRAAGTHRKGPAPCSRCGGKRDRQGHGVHVCSKCVGKGRS